MSDDDLSLTAAQVRAAQGGDREAVEQLFARYLPRVTRIVAARIKDRVHRPVIAFAAVGDGELKGSARSVPGVHMRDALAAVSDRNPGLLARFGGHAMAAGLSLEAAELETFRAAFDAEVRRVSI